MIALIDTNSAKEGYDFIYMGEAEECSKCALRIPCHHSLEAGRKYVITSVRGIPHLCPVFGQVEVCEVSESEVEITISPGHAFIGSNITFHTVSCDKKLCSHFNLCLPEGLIDGDRCTITLRRDNITCPEKGFLAVVVVRRI